MPLIRSRGTLTGFRSFKPFCKYGTLQKGTEIEKIVFARLTRPFDEGFVLDTSAPVRADGGIMIFDQVRALPVNRPLVRSAYAPPLSGRVLVSPPGSRQKTPRTITVPRIATRAFKKGHPEKDRIFSRSIPTPGLLGHPSRQAYPPGIPYFENTICQSWFRRARKLPAHESR